MTVRKLFALHTQEMAHWSGSASGAMAKTAWQARDVSPIWFASPEEAQANLSGAGRAIIEAEAALQSPFED
jgi:hypothetical protein